MDLRERGDGYEIVSGGEVIGAIAPNAYGDWILRMDVVQIRLDSLDSAKRCAARYAKMLGRP